MVKNDVEDGNKGFVSDVEVVIEYPEGSCTGSPNVLS